MVYLLTFGWPWFAAACALGALVGYLTTSRDKDAAVAGGWVIVVAALALGVGGAVSWLDALDGRAAVAFDTALLASAVYLFALPLGVALKSISALAPAPKARRPVVAARGASAEAPRLKVAPQPAAPEVPVGLFAAGEKNNRPASDMPALAAKALNAKAARMRAPSGGRPFPGARPELLSSPRGGGPDDLARLKGLGPKSVEKLHALGVFHYDQIAVWNVDNAKWISAAIGAPGRVERNDWIEQARALTGVDAPRAADAA